MKVAIPHHGEDVTPYFEYTGGITIYEIHKNRVVAQTDFTLRSSCRFTSEFRVLRLGNAPTGHTFAVPR